MAKLTREEYLKKIYKHFKTAQEMAEEIAVLGRTPARTTKLRKAHKQARAILHRCVRYGLMAHEEAKGLWDRESVPDPKFGKVRYEQPFADDYEAARGDELEGEDADAQDA